MDLVLWAVGILVLGWVISTLGQARAAALKAQNEVRILRAELELLSSRLLKHAPRPVTDKPLEFTQDEMRQAKAMLEIDQLADLGRAKLAALDAKK